MWYICGIFLSRALNAVRVEEASHIALHREFFLVVSRQGPRSLPVCVSIRAQGCITLATCEVESGRPQTQGQYGWLRQTLLKQQREN